MNTRANPRRAKQENVDGGVPPQGLQGDQVPIGNQENEVPVVPPAMTNEEIRAAFLTLDQAMTAQANRDVGLRVNANESTVASRFRDFVRMNPPNFLGSRVEEDPQEFLDEIYKIVDAMGVSSREKAELASYQLKESKLKRLGRDLKRGRSDEQGQPRIKKRAPNQDSSSAPKDNQGTGGGSQFVKPTCHTCGKKHFGKSLAGTNGCCGCGKNDNKVRDCPTLAARGRDTRQASFSGPKVDDQKKTRFYSLQDNNDKGANPNGDAGKL
ncbi:uncharacterized protein LOC125832866 [Solanum verrucosum]|uniref:uncharacterized protein LOC125832866 n=1 Tax=Solanum verrucosum TaxID=315347 RepID=UPI0020D151E7|nr:uncharacterized protein LOC125832866 [Solanum verrucosum]